MLEAIVLDNTERLLANGPYISGVPKMRVIHSERDAASTTNPFAHTVGGSGGSCLYNDVLDYFLFTSPQTGNYIHKLDLTKYASTSPMCWQDNSLYLQQLCMEPGGTGRVWGFAKNNNANDGLWVRSTSGTWTKIVGATANNSQRMLVKPNGDLWYFNITANNWYQLQNGAAGNVQTTVPTGLNYGASQSIPGDSWYNPEQFQSCYIGGIWHANALAASLNTLVDSFPQIGSNTIDSKLNPVSYNYNTYLNTYRAIHSSGSGGDVYGGNSTTYLNSVPEELYWSCRMAIGGGGYYQRWIRLDSTYSLVVLGVSATLGYTGSGISGATWYTRHASGEPARQKIGLVLYNKVTNTIRYLGSVPIPNQIDAVGTTTSEPAVTDFLVLGARMKSGAIDLVLSGTLGKNGAGTISNTGAIWMQIPLLKLDF